MAWIIRLFLMLAAPITALFVARDALNFGVVQTFVAMVLVAGLIAGGAVWSLRRGSRLP
jgi:hypothetical protein